MEYRIEHDSMGEMKVPKDALWGAQTQRSCENFRIGVGIETMPPEIIHAFGILKKAAARVNHVLQPARMTDEKLEAVEKACDEVIDGLLIAKFLCLLLFTFLFLLFLCLSHRRELGSLCYNLQGTVRSKVKDIARGLHLAVRSLVW